MEYRSLSKAQRDLYHETVAGTHHRDIELHILTLDGTPVTSVTSKMNTFLGGSIQGDVANTPIEVLEADILDEDFALDWTNGQHRRYKARVIDSRFIPDLDDWVDEVAFTGPLWDFSRQGPVLSIVAHGSERLAMGSVRRVFTRPRKSKATDVMLDLLSAAGAQGNDVSIPNLPTILPERVTVGVRRGKHDDKDNKHSKNSKGQKKQPKRRVFRADQEDTYWAEADRIANGLNRELFPDGRGVFCLRTHATRPSLVFDAATILSPVTEKRPESEGEVPNTWLVLGADPKGPKGRVKVEVTLPARHPLSAQTLAWNGTPRQVIVRIENKHIRTEKSARAIGERRRDQQLAELVEYQVEALPVIPWMRPNAMVSVPTAFGRATMRARQWTLPLGPGADPLTIGANRRRGWPR